MSLGTSSLGLVSLGLVRAAAAPKAPFALLTIPPNWATEVIETLEWQTDIVESFNRIEQRVARAWVPKQQISYDTLTVDGSSRRLDEYLHAMAESTVAMPAWMEVVRLSAGAAAGSRTLYCDPQLSRLQADKYAVLFRSPHDYELVKIDEVLADRVKLVYPLRSAWLADAKLLPVIRGTLDLTTKVKRLSSAVSQASISFTVSAEDVYAPDGVAPTTLGGLEVVTERHNWTEGIDAEVVLAAEDLSYEVGITSRLARGRYALVRRSFAVLLPSRADTHRFRAFLTRRKGRLAPCLVSTGATDFVVSRDEAPASVSVSIAEIEPRVVPPALRGAYGIEIKTPNATLVKPVIDAYSAPGRTIIALGEPIGQTLLAADVLRTSLVHYSRLSADKVSIKWRSAEVAECSVTFESITRRAGGAV